MAKSADDNTRIKLWQRDGTFSLVQERNEWRACFQMGVLPTFGPLLDYRENRNSEAWRASTQVEELCEYVLHLEAVNRQLVKGVEDAALERAESLETINEWKGRFRAMADSKGNFTAGTGWD